MNMLKQRADYQRTASPIAPSAVQKSLFDRKALAWLWLPIRIYLGYQWLAAGRAKLGSASWMRTGTALKGFWQHAVNAPVGGPHGVVYYTWYHTFLQYMLVHQWYTWFAKLIAVGETGIGVLLILGACTGLAAGLGASLNFNYMLAGSLSSNPMLFALAILLLLRWRFAGYLGIDYLLLHRVRIPGLDAARRLVYGPSGSGGTVSLDLPTYGL